MWKFLLKRRTDYRILNEMIEEAMQGSFEESHYDESELSKLEVKWKRFLSMSDLSRRKIEEERAEIKELISDISHQVKTPLSNILLYSQMLNECVEDDNIKTLAVEIERQSEKLDFLLQSLVKISRLETGILKLTQERCSLFPMLFEVREQALGRAQKKQIAIILEEPDREVFAAFDKKWTAEAVANIVDNAIKYSGEKKQIRIFIREYELFACIGIEDQGIGISEEEIPKIFQRFYRGKAVRQEEGVGIGLFLARQIVEGQQGYIRVVSCPGKGSVFFVYLRKPEEAGN